jgi:uncharacterized protein YjbI with pentapeptide repeats
VLDGLTDHDGWSECAITGSAVAVDAELVEIGRGTIRGVRFTAAQLRRAELTDLVVTDCDFSGAVLEELTLNRVAFVGCRFDGADLGGASLIDVSFSECQLNEVGMRMVRAERLAVTDSSAVGIDLYRAWLTASRWHDTDLTGAQLSGAHFERARLHGSTISEVRGAGALRGSVIGPDQTVEVGLALIADAGVEIESSA